jgi:hypothetical protein
MVDKKFVPLVWLVVKLLNFLAIFRDLYPFNFF